MSDTLFPIMRSTKPAPSPITLVEITVPSNGGPFLVTGTSRLVWVPKAARSGLIRAGVMVGQTVDGLLLQIVAEIIQTSSKCQWGSVHPYTEGGFAAAVGHLGDYGHTEVDVFMRDSLNWKHPHVRNVIRTPWMPEEMLVAVPTDRRTLGLLIQYDNDAILAVVNDPSRGLAVASRA